MKVDPGAPRILAPYHLHPSQDARTWSKTSHSWHRLRTPVYQGLTCKLISCYRTPTPGCGKGRVWGSGLASWWGGAIRIDSSRNILSSSSGSSAQGDARLQDMWPPNHS